MPFKARLLQKNGSHKCGVLDSPLPYTWIQNGQDRAVAAFNVIENVNFTVTFVREKASTKYIVWDATFEPTPETMKHWKLPPDKIFSVIRQDSMKSVYAIFSTVIAVMKEFLVAHEKVLIHMSGEEESRKKLYPRMLRRKFQNDIVGYKHWSKWLGDEWLVPKEMNDTEITSLSTKV